MSKKYVKKNGEAVRILATDLADKDYPVAVETYFPNGMSGLEVYTEDGFFYSDKRDSEYNLVEKALEISVGKRYRTRDGRIAQIASMSMRSPIHHVGAVIQEERNSDTYIFISYTSKGLSCSNEDESPEDLIEEII